MSLADITINSKVYSVRSINGSRVLRAGTVATLPANCIDTVLDISHEFSATKANRSLVKFNRVVLDSLSVPQNITLHAVITAPKSLTPAQIVAQLSGTAGMSDDLADIFSLDTYTFSTRMLNGEFS